LSYTRAHEREVNYSERTCVVNSCLCMVRPE